MAKVKMELTFKDGRTQSLEFECDDFTVSQEQGIRKLFDGPGPPEMEYNGQMRLTLKAWRGCPSYDAFVTDESVDRVGGRTLRVTQKTNKEKTESWFQP